MRKRKRILLLVETSGVYGRRIIEGVSRFALEQGDWTLFLEDRGLQDQQPRWLSNVQCDGLITRSVNIDAVKRTKTLGIPFVELLGDGELARAEVLFDSEQGGKLAADHFLERGLRHFAFFTFGHAWWSLEFGNYYKDYLLTKNYSCEISPFCSIDNAPSLPIVLGSKTEHAIVRWLRSLPKPIGLLCPSDTQAVFLANLCQVFEIAVPNEIAILGLGDHTTLCKTVTPPISSIFADGRQTGYRAAELLLFKMRKKTLPKLPIKIFPTSIVTRQSTDFFAVDDKEVALAAQFIRNHITDRIRVDDVAEHVQLSTRTLIRKFRQFFGRTPEQEILRTRMDYAKMLLRDTELTVNETAEKLGYLSAEYFIRAFRADCGMTPKQYRQNFLAEP